MPTCDRCGQEHEPGAECKGDAAWVVAEMVHIERKAEALANVAVIASYLRAFAARGQRLEAAARAVVEKRAGYLGALLIEGAAQQANALVEYEAAIDALKAALDSKGKEAGDADA